MITVPHPRTITVRLWGKGVTLRDEVTGAEIASERRYVVRAGQFILSRIDARNGAFGIVPDALDGGVVSTDFPVFNVNTERMESAFLGWMSKTAAFVDLCKAASEGTTNRVRLKEDKFLVMQIPLPPIAEQRRIVARIEELAVRIAEARGLRRRTIEEVNTFSSAAAREAFTRVRSGSPSCPIKGAFRFRTDLIRPTDGVTGSLRFVGLQHVESDTGKQLGEAFISAETLDGRKFRFSPGEIVYGYLRPYLNKVWVADREGICSVDQYVLRPVDSEVDTHYLAHFMRSPSFVEQAKILTNNLMLPRLRSGLLESVAMPRPSLSEQRSIVAYLDDMQAKVTAVRRLQAETAAELDALLPSVLDRAFRGAL